MCSSDLIGDRVEVVVEFLDDEGHAVGHAAHQGPDDATTTVLLEGTRPGDIVTAIVVDVDGVDLIAEPA